MKAITRIQRLRECLNRETKIIGWVVNIREHKKVIFLDVEDYTGTVQVVLNKSILARMAPSVRLNPESLVSVTGIARLAAGSKSKPDIEFYGISLSVLSSSNMKISPRSARIARQAISWNNKRHLYIRHPLLKEILLFRSHLKSELRNWFLAKGFIEIDAPILTPTLLYPDTETLECRIARQPLYLSQCVGMYLEAAVHVFERVFNIGPSFRNEKSKSPRHLLEFWHVKAEIALADLDYLISFSEALVRTAIRTTLAFSENLTQITIDKEHLNLWLESKWPKFEYRDVVGELQNLGCTRRYGQSLDSCLEKHHISSSPFWVVHNPKNVEPFPYRLSPTGETLTADLFLPSGFGELLGVAEKTCDLAELDQRMLEKGIPLQDTRYAWVRELRQAGCIPHGGIGMGFERIIRWLLKLSHVRETLPFPREWHRQILV